MTGLAVPNKLVERCDRYWGPKIKLAKELIAADESDLEVGPYDSVRAPIMKFHRELLERLKEAKNFCYREGLEASKSQYQELTFFGTR